jgi:hypothetical protein
VKARSTMKLPNAENVGVEITKLRDYCLSPTHIRGKNKARVFLAVLGLSNVDALELQSALKNAAYEGDAVRGVPDLYGVRYIIDFELTRNEKTAKLRSSWIVPANEGPPRFRPVTFL